MGKIQQQPQLLLPVQQNLNGSCSSFVGFRNGFKRLFSFKCLFMVFLGFGVSLFGLFSVVKFHHRGIGFDAKESIKQSATVQAYFRLEKPVSYLIPQISRLEYDINDEIGAPGTQVAILSMHKSCASNWTDVVFGVLSQPVNSPINPVSLSVLRSSLIDLFTQRSNLTLTKTIFGMPSSFEILKCPGGITIIPKLSPPVLMLPKVLFNFTLRNSLQDIEENFLQLKVQLKSGLQLMPSENIFVQVTNKAGSTKDPPVTVQASVVSTLGGLDPQRLKELAQEIRESPPAKNLGLDNAVFGKVKEISLSSFLFPTLDAPTPSPAPSPDQNDHMGPNISPSPGQLAPSPDNEPKKYLPPVSNTPPCGGSSISPAPSPVSVPSHHALPPRASTSPPPRSEMPPNLSPLPAVSYGSRPHQDNGYQKGLAPSPHSVLPSSSSSMTGVLYRIICPFFFIILITVHIL